jgi:hypothetical protein
VTLLLAGESSQSLPALLLDLLILLLLLLLLGCPSIFTALPLSLLWLDSRRFLLDPLDGAVVEAMLVFEDLELVLLILVDLLNK